MTPQQEYDLMWKVYVSIKTRSTDVRLFEGIFAAPDRIFKLAIIKILIELLDDKRPRI